MTDDPGPTLGQRAEIARRVWGEPHNIGAKLDGCLLVRLVLERGVCEYVTEEEARRIRAEAKGMVPEVVP